MFHIILTYMFLYIHNSYFLMLLIIRNSKNSLCLNMSVIGNNDYMLERLAN